ncbi:MAG: exonuclease domain-containing protein [Pseudomonadota bacterium]
MEQLGLRTRIVLFFALIAFGGIAVGAVGLWLGYRQAADPEILSAFMTSFIAMSFGLLVLVAGIWLLFDENVAKPLQALSAELRARVHGGIDTAFDHNKVKYLGDLGPAAAEMARRLRRSVTQAEDVAEARTATLATEREYLLRLLSDIPFAVILVNTAHQIVLYDGQAAQLMEKEAPPRLMGSLFDYLNEDAVLSALKRLEETDRARKEIVVTSLSGQVYSGFIRRLEDDAGYNLILEPLDAEAERPMTFDFSLLDSAPGAMDEKTPLRAMPFVVFDSETTGLDPERDELVQLAGLRIVNRQIVCGEAFDTLVDPGRKIPQASFRVHGISTDMVQGAPDPVAACGDFHDFCADACLIAHNAPFDLAFLRRHAGQNGGAFDHPVLDTVLLSAIVYGMQEIHTLDALCERLGVEIVAEDRHTAMGDARATAEVFLRLLPILEAQGLSTMGDVLAAMRRHRRLLKDANV